MSIKLDAAFVPTDLQAAAAKMLPQAVTALTDLQAGRCAGAEFTGWYDWPKRHGLALAKSITQYVRSLDVYFDMVLVIGIGGSYLGCRAVAAIVWARGFPSLGKEFAMNKWMSVAALGLAMVVGGCKCMDKDKDKDMSSSEPKKMSVDASKKCADGKCCKSTAAAAPAKAQ